MAKKPLIEEIREFRKSKKKLVPVLVILGVLGLVLPILPGLAFLFLAAVIIFPQQDPRPDDYRLSLSRDIRFCLANGPATTVKGPWVIEGPSTTHTGRSG